MLKLLKRGWIPLVIVIVLVVAGFTVMRIRTFFGGDPNANGASSRIEDTKPFNPKVVKYEIWGDGSYANVNYLDLDAEPQRVDRVSLP